MARQGGLERRTAGEREEVREGEVRMSSEKGWKEERDKGKEKNSKF